MRHAKTFYDYVVDTYSGTRSNAGKFAKAIQKDPSFPVNGDCWAIISHLQKMEVTESVYITFVNLWNKWEEQK